MRATKMNVKGQPESGVTYSWTIDAHLACATATAQHMSQPWDGIFAKYHKTYN